MWEKWVMLSTAGGITCLLRGNVGEIEAVPGGADLALRFLAESTLRRHRIRLSAAGGVHRAGARDDDRRKAPASRHPCTATCRATRRWRSSNILADMLHRARLLDLPTPLLEAAVAQLRIYQNRAGRKDLKPPSTPSPAGGRGPG